jgi:hypothetical protein
MEMASVSDTRYKQRAVIELLVAEKESVGNIHKRLCAVYGSCTVDRSTVGIWIQRVTASGSEETEIRAVRTWLREHETSWYIEGMHVLVSCCRKAVDVDGDYMEK